MKKQDVVKGMPVIYWRNLTVETGHRSHPAFAEIDGEVKDAGTDSIVFIKSSQDTAFPVSIEHLEVFETPHVFMKVRSMGLTVTEEQMNKIRHFWNNKKLSVWELADALYEGKPSLQNLAEKLARQHGKAGALAPFSMMGEDVQNFWIHIAHQVIEFGSWWEENNGSTCVLGFEGRGRLANLERHPELYNRPKTPFG